MAFLPRIFVPVAVAAALALAWSALHAFDDARASTVVALDLQGLVDGAELGLEARVLETRVERDLLGRPCTVVTLAVTRDFIARTDGVLDVRLPGGILPDGTGLILPGMPRLAAGEEVVLFLSESSSAGLRVPVGLAQGKFRVVRDARGARTLERDGADLTLLDRTSGATSQAHLAAVFDYAAAVAEIEAAVARRPPSARGGK
ncbi:MAG TPA: hypothetical protein VM509_03610 [Planctomycetota bacterium]|nr:hypothetical protein [Planctomycetota bacterium]